MAATPRVLLRTFSSGEITPELFGRIDLGKRQEGLELCKNFITLPHGPAVNRPGTEFVREVKNSANPTRIIPFSFNNTQTFVIELGAGYFRWHTNAATLTYSDGAAWSAATAYNIGDIANSGGVNYYCISANTNQVPPNATYWYAMPTNPNLYEIPNPYAAADLFDIHFVQSADVLTLVHPNYPVLELRRYGATNWQTATPTFTPAANPVTAPTASNNGAATTPTNYTYCVTAVQATGLQESVASASVAIGNDLTVSGRHNTISWTDPSAAGVNVRYYVYKLSNGLFGYIGQASGVSGGATATFDDNNITPDVTKTPPIADADAAFTGAGNYPQAVSYFQQRRIFAGTANKPQNFWATRSGTESNMSYNIPVQSDNRIAVRIAAREASAIRHIVPAGQLLLLTATAEWRCSAAGDVLTPASINLTPQSYVGASNVPPVVINNLVLYAAARGGHVRELSYSWQASSFVSGDVSLMAPHLFDYQTIVDMCYSRGPIPILWAISSSGKLLGLTYVPEQDVAAWHQHTTGAADVFEGCCVITENNEDMLYVIVHRTINGASKRYVERLHTRRFDTLGDAFFVDAGLTYSGALATMISGLSHLEGATVNVLADGAVVPPQVVTGGQITLPTAASKVTVGLPIVAQFKSLPVTMQSDGAYAQGRVKNVNKVWLRVYRSSGLRAGPDFNHLVTYAQRSTESYGTPPNLVSDEVEIVLTPGWGSSGQVCVQQSDPLPLDLVSMALEVATGA